MGKGTHRHHHHHRRDHHTHAGDHRRKSLHEHRSELRSLRLESHAKLQKLQRSRTSRSLWTEVLIRNFVQATLADRGNTIEALERLQRRHRLAMQSAAEREAQRSGSAHHNNENSNENSNGSEHGASGGDESSSSSSSDEEEEEEEENESDEDDEGVMGRLRLNDDDNNEDDENENVAMDAEFSLFGELNSNDSRLGFSRHPLLEHPVFCEEEDQDNEADDDQLWPHEVNSKEEEEEDSNVGFVSYLRAPVPVHALGLSWPIAPTAEEEDGENPAADGDGPVIVSSSRDDRVRQMQMESALLTSLNVCQCVGGAKPASPLYYTSISA